MTSPSPPSSPASSSDNPDAPLLNGLAELTALVRQTNEEINESCDAMRKRHGVHQGRDIQAQTGQDLERRQSAALSEGDSLLGRVRDEVKELVNVVEELREDPEAARLNTENDYLRRVVEYQIQKNQHDLSTSIQTILQTLRDQQEAQHAELLRVLREGRKSRSRN